MGKKYRVLDAPKNGTSPQFCGEFLLSELPLRLQEAIRTDPDATEWRLPALSGGVTGEVLDDLSVVIAPVDRTGQSPLT